MYIEIEEVNGEKTINLPFPIDNTDQSKKVAVVSLFSENIRYIFKTDRMTLSHIYDEDMFKEVIITKGSYSSRELRKKIGFPFTEPILSDKNIQRQNKMLSLTEMNFTLNEINNTETIINENVSNTLYTYHITNWTDEVTFFEPKNPQYKKMKNGVISSITLTIKDQSNNIIKDELGTTVLLHVR